MPAVTISAGYGAGGSVVARTVAELLGYPLLDRAISSEVARRLQCTVEEAQDGSMKRSFVERFFTVLAPMAGGVIGTDADSALQAVLPGQEGELFRDEAEKIMRAALPGGAVILGRAGAFALHDEPGVLRVRLFGPKNARIAQAARVQGIDEQTAAGRLPEVDNARAHYVHRLYGRDIDDPEVFHLHLDSTAIALSECADLIVTAFHALGADAGVTGRRA
ncbi:MAG TPA: cytidylate kinase-like family protein [Jatrophihabitans sp.]|nr:cytidylate kinase-like family protein [Jatrophihabitans sp.]